MASGDAKVKDYLIYHRGMIGIVARMLSLLSERGEYANQEAFELFLGMVWNMKSLFHWQELSEG